MAKSGTGKLALLNVYDAGAPTQTRARGGRARGGEGRKPAASRRARGAEAEAPPELPAELGAPGDAAETPAPAPSLADDNLLGAQQLVNTRVPAAAWTALAERARYAGVNLRVAVSDALLAALELPPDDHAARLHATLLRETEARAAAHQGTT